MTDMKRITISIPEDMEKAIFGLRKRDEYTRCSTSEVIRQLVDLGLQSVSGTMPSTTKQDAVR